MAVVYYPREASIYTRTVTGSNLIELNIGVLPRAVFFFTGSTYYTASTLQTGRSIVLASSFTPTGTGADTAEVSIPYDPKDGSSSLAWAVTRISLRTPIAETTTSSVDIEKSAGGGLFSASLVGSVSLYSGSYETFVTASSLNTVISGDKVRFNVTRVGTATSWTIITEISNN